jgi:hypothetical protein
MDEEAMARANGRVPRETLERDLAELEAALIAERKTHAETRDRLASETILCRGILKEMEKQRYEIAALLKIKESENNQADSPWWKLIDMIQLRLKRRLINS